ncbi:MAG: transketolase [Candidatus Edwardsbacteria bacterium]
MNTYDISEYERLCKDVRRTVLKMIYETKSPHIGSSFSAVEILAALFFKYIRIDCRNPFDEDRDRFILSKGHACSTFYVVLYKKGFLKEEDLKKFAVNNGLLEQHPTRDVQKGIEISTGSLGHGLSIGVGMALAAKRDKKNYRIFVLLSDGELNEGSVWEAIMFAAHHRLDNLVAIVDCNKVQALGHTRDIINMEPLSEKWLSFGWVVKEIDGHDFKQIFEVFDLLSFSTGKPNVIIAHTTKGKGVSFMEDNVLWHYRAPDDKEYKMALRELLE